MQDTNVFVLLKQHSPLYGIFPSGKCPVLSYERMMAREKRRITPEEFKRDPYQIDTARLTDEQMLRISEIHVKDHGGTVDEMIDFMKRFGRFALETEWIDSLPSQEYQPAGDGEHENRTRNSRAN